MSATRGVVGRGRRALLQRARTASPELKVLARALLSLPAELRDRVRGGRDPLVPPRALWFVGGGADFVASGDRLAAQIVAACGLRPDERVLEVGCGIGRIARPLTRHLSAAGTWDGFDVVPRAIAWCERAYAGHPNFRFHHADVHNAKYHPRGRIAAGEYRFPFADASFDVIYLTSVFTHMLRPDVEHYTDEIARVLAPGGRAFLTYFLLGPDVHERLAAGTTTMRFDVELPGARAMHAGSPEAAVAYEEGDVRAMLTASGLELAGPPRYGSWSGRPDHLTFQDVVVVRRPA